MKVTTSQLVGVLQPFQDDRGIESAGVGEHDFFDFAHVLLSFSDSQLFDLAQQQVFHQRLLYVQPVLGLVPHHAIAARR